MQAPPEITFHNLDHSPAIEARIRRRIDKLGRFFDGILTCRVSVEAGQKRRNKGNLYAVHIKISVPGRQIVVSHNGPRDASHADLYVALQDAFDAADRRLEDYARKLRGDVKRHEPPTHGRVSRLFPEDGYGFVSTADGREVYFHAHSVAGEAFEQLERGSEVRIVIAEGEGENGPQASTVRPIGKHHIVP